MNLIVYHDPSSSGFEASGVTRGECRGLQMGKVMTANREHKCLGPGKSTIFHKDEPFEHKSTVKWG